MKSQLLDHVLIQNPLASTGTLLDHITLPTLIDGYTLNCRCEGKSQATIESYQHKLACFTWFCQVAGYSDEPLNITVYHIREFLWYLASEPNRWGGNSIAARKPASQATVNGYYRVLHSFFNWLCREELISDNPLKRIKSPKLESRLVQALTQHEVERLLDRCAGKSYLDVRNRAVIMMLLDAGMRVSELADLMISDIDTRTGGILIRRGKGGKERVVRIGSRAQKALWRYVALHRRGESGRLLLNRSGEPLDTTGIKLMVRRLGRKACIANVHVHRLRHTFAINFLRAGGDVFSLQYLLGHSTLAMTQRYLQSLNASDAISAHKRFSPLDNMFTRKE